MNPVILICSRRASSRLPEKAVKPIAGRSPIRHILSRVCGSGVKVVLCVPPDEEATYLEQVQGYEAELFLGDPNSPLHRMADYLVAHPEHDWVVRITHDDCLIHWRTVAAMLDFAAKQDSSFGYVKCPGIVEGAGVELIHRENLLGAAALRHEPTEFVSYFVQGAGAVRPVGATHIPDQSVRRDYRLTLDYPEDATLLEVVLRRLGMDATAEEVCAYLDEHPDLLNLNRLPLVSVYTCVKNGEKWIGEAIRSVLGYGLVGMEYVIVDDGSTDGTVDIVSQYAGKVKLVVNQNNMGLASSSNVALKHCRGKFVMRLDADDRLDPSAFAGIASMVGLDADAVYPAYANIGESGKILSYQDHPEIDHHAGGALFRKSVLNEIRFRDGLRHWDGLELYERLRASKAKVLYAPDNVVWHYRQTKGSMSRSEPAKRAALKASILGPIAHD